MNSFIQLEFDKIKNYISDACFSEYGKLMAQNVSPLKNISEITKKLDLTADIKQWINDNSIINLEFLTDVTFLLTEYQHQVYDFDEFRQIIRNLSISNHLLRLNDEYLDKETTENFQKLLNQLTYLPSLEKRYSQIFASDGEVLDTASPTLNSIRRRRNHLRSKIQSNLQKSLNDHQMEKMIQDKVITQRENRFVIPIKEGAVSFVEGIVHGKSSSKSTVFIEPKAIVPLNNELHTLKEDEKEEIYKIFLEFTAQIKESADSILLNSQVLQKMDFYQAVVKFSMDIQASIPEIVEEPYLELFKARHPILIKKLGSVKKVIPFDLTIGDDFNILLISGPNTGGKTVTLKTIGLLTLMALSGLPIPAESSSKIGLFSNIFADIGDEQSIENSLSTFSSHITRINEMVNTGNSNSLVLLDEIGSATDPEQGSALAQAILERFVEKKMVGVITTHYTALKIFAENSELCMNAAMQFDPDRHSPTYQFKLGLPGNSFAIEIASQLGMDVDLIERAKKLTGDQNVELTNLLRKMNNEKKELASQTYQYKLKTRLLSQKASEYELKVTEIENQSKAIKKKAVIDARDYLTTLQKELNSELADIKKEDKETRKKSMQKAFDKVSKLNTELAKKVKKTEEKLIESVTNPEIGQVVWVKDFESDGIIVEIFKKSVKVDVNGFFFTTDLDKIFKTNRKISTTSQASQENLISEKQVHTELKILGNTFEEALPKIDDFIDEAILAGLNKIRIVHGKGTGVLRSKVRQYLRKNKKIVSFYSPASEAGGNGVTVVSFS